MRTKREINLDELGLYVEPPNVPASIGRTVRCLDAIPLDGVCVYTQGDCHHRLRQGQLGVITAISPEGLLTLRFRYRERLVSGVPLNLVEMMPEKLKIVGTLTDDNVCAKADVEFALECPVDGRCRWTEDIPHHVIEAGTAARVVTWARGQATVVIEGRRRPVHGVPFSLLDRMAVGGRL